MAADTEDTISPEKFPECALEIHFMVCHALSFAPSVNFLQEGINEELIVFS